MLYVILVDGVGCGKVMLSTKKTNVLFSTKTMVLFTEKLTTIELYREIFILALC